MLPLGTAAAASKPKTMPPWRWPRLTAVIQSPTGWTSTKPTTGSRRLHLPRPRPTRKAEQDAQRWSATVAQPAHQHRRQCHTISYTYDALNRKTGEYDGPNSSSPPIAAWAYDNSNNAVAGMSNPIGQLTTETSYSGGQPYTIQQQGFNTYGEPVGETVTLPPAEGALAPSGGYTISHTYIGDTDLPYKTPSGIGRSGRT
jgi:hypothetical protein